MSIFGVSMVRDELDILPYTLPRMMAQLDHIVVSDNNSTDGTREWLAEYACDHDITVIWDPDPAYTQSAKMSFLGRLAGEMGATWVTPFDADEVWIADPPLNEYLPPMSAHVIQADLFDHVVTGTDDLNISDTVRRIGWRRVDRLPLPKVACRVLPGLVIEQGNHSARYPGPHTTEWTGVVVHHFPYRSVPQMIRKARQGAAAYEAAGNRVPAGAGAHWKGYAALTDEQIAEVFCEWFYSDHPDEDTGLVYDPLP